MATSYDVAVKIAGKVDPSLIKSSQKASGLISSIVKADLIASGIKTVAGAFKNFATDSIKSYATFEQSLANAGAIAGATGKELEAMKKAALEAGRTTQFTAAQSADALGYMSIAGWDAKTSIENLQPMLKFAAATGTDLATAADQVTDTLGGWDGWSNSVQDVTKYLDVLTITNNKANTTASMLMEAFKGCSANAQNAGLSMQQTSAVLGILANNGIKGSEAGTALNSMLSRMTGNKAALKAYKDLGVRVFDANGKIRDFGTILKETDQKLSKLSDEKKAAAIKEIAGVNFAGQYQYLLKGARAVNGQASEYDKLYKSIMNADGAVQKMYDKTTATMEGAFSRFSSAIDGARLALIEKFAPHISAALDFISEKVMPKVTEGIEKFTTKMITLGTFVKNVATVLFNFGTGADLINAKMYLSAKYGFDFTQILMKIKSVLDVIIPIMATVGSNILSVAGYLFNIKNVISDVTQFYKDHEDAINLVGIALAGLGVALVAYNASTIQAAANTKIITLALRAQAMILPLVNGLLGTMGAIWAFITSPIFLVVAAITAVIAVCYLLWKHWDKVSAWIKGAWEWLCNALTSKFGWYFDAVKANIEMMRKAWGAVCNFFKFVWSAVCDYFVNRWNDAVALFKAVFNGLKAIFALYVDNFKIVFNGICDFVRNVFAGDFKGAWDSITGIFAGVWENFKNIAKAPLNWIIDKINTVISGINSVKVPDWVPGVGGKGANISQIPALASGGIVSRPTLAMIGEGGEREAVIPLSKLNNLLAQNRGSDFNSFANSKPMSANFGGNSVTFAPVINVQGGANVKSDIKSALNDGFAEFKKYMAQYQNETRRRSFNGF